eukprot:SAG31_NODE_24093_length_489_cov_1.056410_1_plen_119_part_01
MELNGAFVLAEQQQQQSAATRAALVRDNGGGSWAGTNDFENKTISAVNSDAAMSASQVEEQGYAARIERMEAIIEAQALQLSAQSKMLEKVHLLQEEQALAQTITKEDQGLDSDAINVG